MFEANYEAEEIIVLIFVIEIFLKLLALGCHLDVENLKGKKSLKLQMCILENSHFEPKNEGLEDDFPSQMSDF